MGSINKSHIEENGGLLLFNGELVLLYSDSVSCEIGGKESFKGRVYLTTHRLVVVITPFRQNAPVKSFCAPFCAITKCGVEQPIFGANYIEATVRDEADPTKSFSFKLKFSKGGAIELAMVMNRASQFVGRNYASSMQPLPAYTPSPSAQYYQAPPTVYAPGYNSGIPMPTQQFPDQPPIGFIYASDAPPPYPGIGGQGGQAPPSYAGSQGPQAGSYPGQQPTQHQAWAGNNPGAGYPGQQQASQQQQQWGGYPGQQVPTQPWSSQASTHGPASAQSIGGYPGQQMSTQPWANQAGAYGPAPSQPTGGYPSGAPQPTQQQPSSAGYPDLSGAGYPGPQPNAGQQQQQYPSQQSGPNQAWPTAPSINPNWQDDKKNA